MPHRPGSLARRRNLRRALLLPVLTLLWLTWPACTGISGGAIVARDPGYLKRNEMEIVRGGGDDLQAIAASSQILAALAKAACDCGSGRHPRIPSGSSSSSFRTTPMFIYTTRAGATGVERPAGLDARIHPRTPWKASRRCASISRGRCRATHAAVSVTVCRARCNRRASLALLASFHRALRLTRCMHRHHLANLVTPCGRFCLRLQRDLLRVQRLGRRLRLGGAFGLFHDESRLSAQRLIQVGFEISDSAWAAGRISELSTAKSPSATMPTSRLLRSTTGKRLT